MSSDTIIGFLAVLLIVFIIVGSYKGFLYDILKEEIDKKYNENHSIVWKYNRLRFSIPRFINDSSENVEVQKRKKEYNRISALFWITAITILIISFKNWN